jgi:polyphosphate kinase
LKRYACIGTGNFNEETSRVFSDQLLCTSDVYLTREVNTVFDFFEQNYNIGQFKHLLVSPFTMRKKLTRMIRQEITNAKSGMIAKIYIKCNNLVDIDIINRLYEAARSGVEVRLNVRGMFSLYPHSPEGDYSIPAIGMIDRFLEHSRIYYFYNAGKEKLYISSSDLMSRNLDRRVEVAAPIYDKGIRDELLHFINLQWQDNSAARILDNNLNNYILDGQPKIRSQITFYEYLREQSSK